MYYYLGHTMLPICHTQRRLSTTITSNTETSLVVAGPPSCQFPYQSLICHVETWRKHDSYEIKGSDLVPSNRATSREIGETLSGKLIHLPQYIVQHYHNFHHPSAVTTQKCNALRCVRAPRHTRHQTIHPFPQQDIAPSLEQGNPISDFSNSTISL